MMIEHPEEELDEVKLKELEARWRLRRVKLKMVSMRGEWPEGTLDEVGADEADPEVWCMEARRAVRRETMQREASRC